MLNHDDNQLRSVGEKFRSVDAKLGEREMEEVSEKSMIVTHRTSVTGMNIRTPVSSSPDVKVARTCV